MITRSFGSISKKDIRCKKCNKLVAKSINSTCFELKCSRCGTLNVVFEEMLEQVIITDADGKIVYMNRAVEFVTGYDIKESIGRKPSELWGGEMEKEFYENMWKIMLEDKKSINFNVVNRKKSGELYEVELIVSPIVDNSGKIIYLVGVEMLKTNKH
jgi:PAS domain S-box-containing protein